VSAVPHGFNPLGERSSPPPGAHGVAARVLIVDDHAPTARALAKLLDSANYEATIAHRGADALARARDDGGFVAAIVDLHLPDISGLIVTQQLREALGPQVPIIVLSGDTSMQMLNSLPLVGATYFFSKPVNANAFLERMKHWAPTSAK
jgi:DNA-binding response OmpR family regulator